MGLKITQDNLRPAVLKMVAPSMDALGQAIVARARELVPVDSGFLQSTIGYTYRQDTGSLQVYADAPYALVVEVGGVHTIAQPYLRPALMDAPRLWGMGGR
jgi:hypothetical protein